MLADLVHHVRQQLPYQALASSVHLFSRCIHDPSLPSYVQAMCCKLMLNLVECIVNAERTQEQSVSLSLYFLQRLVSTRCFRRRLEIKKLDI